MERFIGEDSSGNKNTLDKLHPLVSSSGGAEGSMEEHDTKGLIDITKRLLGVVGRNISRLQSLERFLGDDSSSNGDSQDSHVHSDEDLEAAYKGDSAIGTDVDSRSSVEDVEENMLFEVAVPAPSVKETPKEAEDVGDSNQAPELREVKEQSYGAAFTDIDPMNDPDLNNRKGKLVIIDSLDPADINKELVIKEEVGAVPFCGPEDDSDKDLISHPPQPKISIVSAGVGIELFAGPADEENKDIVLQPTQSMISTGDPGVGVEVGTVPLADLGPAEEEDKDIVLRPT